MIILQRNISDDELQTILREHSQWLQTRYTAQPQGKRANLAYAILTGSKALRGVDLRDANLLGAILDGADLRGCLLSGADIEETSFRRSDLRGADLSDSLGFNMADLATARTDGLILQPLDLRQQMDSLQAQIHNLSEAATDKEHQEQNADAENQQINMLEQQLAETTQQAENYAQSYRRDFSEQLQLYRELGWWQRVQAKCSDNLIIHPIQYPKFWRVSILVVTVVVLAGKKHIAGTGAEGLSVVVLAVLLSATGVLITDASVAGALVAGALATLLLAIFVATVLAAGKNFFNTGNLFAAILCWFIGILLGWIYYKYQSLLKKENERYQQTDIKRQDYTFSSQTHRRYRDNLATKNQEIKELKAKLAAEDIGVDKRIQAAKQTLAGALGNADDSIRNNKRAAKICGLFGGGLFVLDGVLLLGVVIYFICSLFNISFFSFKPIQLAALAGSLKDIPAWLVVLFTFPLAATLLIANALLRHQSKLLDEVRHFSAMKHQVELYSGLLEASQHAAHSFGRESQSKYVQETFSKIRDRLLLNDLPAGSPALKDDKDGHADLEKSISEIVSNAVKSSK